MFTDESFHVSGYVNSQKMKMWTTENPHFFTETPSHSQKIAVWAAVSHRRIIGPIFFQGTVRQYSLLNLRTLNAVILTPFVNMLHDDDREEEGLFQQD